MSERAICQETTNRPGIVDGRYRHFTECGKPVSPRDPEGKLCGRHLSVKTRREEKNREWKRQHDAQTENLHKARSLGARLTELTGVEDIRADQYNHGDQKLDGYVTLPTAELIRILGITEEQLEGVELR